MTNWFGKELILDLVDCDYETIRSASELARYVRDLCDVLGMRTYGDPIVAHFGHDDPRTSGYTIVQLIETSNITAHFSELWGSAHINIFSCKEFDEHQALLFTTDFFVGTVINATVLDRMGSAL